jgi:2,4-dienoyl-CoA reductase-like NADH-dependent reductase (Old Yellow Enzyme family)
MLNLLAQPLPLPCGATLPNRIAKAAMTEGLADLHGRPTPELERLYAIWSDGGAGMLLSGNIIIDGDHLERPGNVIIDRVPDEIMMAALTRWTQAATHKGNHFWAQISHAGRQTMKAINPYPKAPSAVKLGIPGGQFGVPIPLTEMEISNIIERFAIAAKACQTAGFTGIQIHGAHGYLFSQFLSPRSNRRTDQYGGVLENRARILLDTVKAVRKVVGPAFPVSVKLNSADFQKGGFAFEDSLKVANWLEEASVDLIEISGGTYEQPKLLGISGMEAEEPQNIAQSTLQREAYFVDFAQAMQSAVSIPLMVTGGFRSRAAMEQALSTGAADVIGLGRPLCYQTDSARRLLEGANELPRIENSLALFPKWLNFLTGIKTLRAIASFAVQYWYYSQLYAIGRTGNTVMEQSVFASFLEVERTQKAWMRKRKFGT